MPSDPRPDRYRVSLSVRVKEEQIERVRSRPCFALVGVLHQQEIHHPKTFDPILSQCLNDNFVIFKTSLQHQFLHPYALVGVLHQQGIKSPPLR